MPPTAPVAERLGLDPTSELWGEHRSRYRFAAVPAIGRRVLDAACGSGFGCQMLRAAGAAAVLGVDLDEAALRGARQAFGAPGLAFARASLDRLPFRSHSLDVIVSFETIEHVADAAAVVAEFARCLAPDGTLILSTPNRLFRPTPDGRPANPFHVREFSPRELTDLLSPLFEVRLFGQRVRPTYRAVPFLLRPEDRGLRSWRAISLLPWKLANRLPFAVKNRLSWLLAGQAFYPTEFDYTFEPDEVEAAHDVVAVATPRRREA